jgi:hypothetical protein
MKKPHLHKTALSKDAITEIAATTLTNGGFVAAEVQSKDREIGNHMSDAST